MTNCSIVVSLYNARPEVIEVIDKLFFPSLLRNASSDKQLILLDDASPLEKETKALVAKYAPDIRSTFGDFHYSRNPQNLGFSRSYNRGMHLAEGANLIITNDDVYLPVGSLDSLVDILKEPQAGLVGPVTNFAFRYQSTHLFGRIKDYSPEELQRIEDFAQELKKKVGRKVVVVERLDGFCMAISGDFVREVGYLDESFTYGFWEDDDYCIRAQKAGHKVLLDASTFVEHGGPRGGSTSFRQDQLKMVKYLWKNAAKLAKKHSIPYHKIARQHLDRSMQFYFDKRTVTAILREYLVQAHTHV